MRTLTLVLTTTLMACSPSLQGDWSGDVTCDTTDVAVEMSLAKAGKSEMEGSFELFVEEAIEEYDSVLELELAYDAVVEFDGRGEQELDMEVELDDVACRLFTGGDLFTDDCLTMGVDPSELEDEDQSVGDLMWDGADTIEVEDEDCSGTITRQ